MGETNFVVTFARMFFGGLIIFGVVAITGSLGSLLALTWLQWLYIIASTILLFAYVLFWYWGIRYINVSKAAALFLISPIISLLGSVFLLGEPAPLLQIAGSAIIIAGSFILIGAKDAQKGGQQ